MTDETRGSAPLTNAKPPTPEEMVASVRRGIEAAEERIDDKRMEIAMARRVIRDEQERIKELKRMLPRKPRTKKAKNENTGSQAP